MTTIRYLHTQIGYTVIVAVDAAIALTIVLLFLYEFNWTAVLALFVLGIVLFLFASLTVEVDEEAIPVSATARHAAELLGLDLLTVANEGKCVAVVPEGDAERALEAIRAHKYGGYAAVVGRFLERAPPLVELVTRAGGRRR